MADHSVTAQPLTPIPADDPARSLTLVHPDDAGLPHVSVVGATYTILVPGAQTEGRYCLVDMLVPPGSGPPPHRHDFEEMFTVLEGDVEFTVRGQTRHARSGTTVNIPSNAPHAFRNGSRSAARMLCLCVPAGQDEFFLTLGIRVDSRTAVPPPPSKEEQARTGMLAKTLLPRFRIELLGDKE
jgi:quercetin dioxygenase-like cupin family protein